MNLIDYLYFRFYKYMLKVTNRYNAVEGGLLILFIISVIFSFLILFISKPLIEFLNPDPIWGSVIMLVLPISTYLGGYHRYIKEDRYKKVIKRFSDNYKENSLFVDVLFILGLILIPLISIFLLMKLFSVYKF